MTTEEQSRVALKSSLPAGSTARHIYIDTVRRLAEVDDRNRVAQIREEAFLASDRCESSRQKLRVCISVVCDLCVQGWTFHVDGSDISGCLPKLNTASPLLEKQRIREAHLFERDSQLRMPATREFVRTMEKQRWGPNGWTSIFSLMRDGSELAGKLRSYLQSADGCLKPAVIESCIDPYIQPIQPDGVCQFTGLRLLDVWRYFRCTWVTPYYSTPGRQIWLLIRDKSTKNHPVIGIAALGSAVVQLTPRDDWIGWTSDAFLKQLQQRPTPGRARWITESLRSLIGGIYIKDFLEEGIFEKSELRQPSDALIQRLLKEAEKARRSHNRYPRSRQHKSTNQDWEAQARTSLFRAKRARVLADLLTARQKLRGARFRSFSRTSLLNALGTQEGRHAIEVILKHVKAVHVGIDMLDITVCGAIPPYNPILGGKLVAMLMASPEVRRTYEEKYSRSASIIASSMAGKPIIRKPRLVMLGTTSLYGNSSSQYNRVTIPAAEVGGESDIAISYEPLGKSVGYGSYHLSKTTVEEIEVLLAQSQNGRRINSIFGEGVNPRLRKIRSGLSEAGLPSDILLLHGNPRLIYGVRLALNFREILIGRNNEARYILPKSSAPEITKAIFGYWARRWLFKRIGSENVLKDVESHSLTHPIGHGARVVLPIVEANYPLLATAG